jgi:putative heme iron utilization protein
MAANVAEINGYQFNQPLSNHNQKMTKSLRFIYEAGEGKQKIYLSTDERKRRF